jgi:hypothetical protein
MLFMGDESFRWALVANSGAAHNHRIGPARQAEQNHYKIKS